MAENKKRDLTDRIVDRMVEARDEVDDPWDQERTLKVQAAVAQDETAALIRAIAQSLIGVCIRAGHRGSTRPTETSVGAPCIRCKSKVKHYRETADFISPPDGLIPRAIVRKEQG